MRTLSEKDISIIKSTWELPKAQAGDAGIAILLRLFEKYPYNQNEFAAFKNKPLTELKNSASFRTHAKRVMKIFDESIEALDNENSFEELKKIWSQVATSHFKRNNKKQSFKEVIEVILEVLTSAYSLNPEQQAAWEILLENVGNLIFSTMDKLASQTL